MKKIIPIILFFGLLTPLLSSAQTTPAIPSIPDLNVSQALSNSLPGPVSDFIQKLKDVFLGGIFKTGTTLPSVNISNVNLSGAQNVWDQINNWFSTNIGVSFRDIIRAVVNLIIWIWELIIKLIRVGLSYL